MFKVYVLYNQGSDKIYIGYTSDLENRMRRHNREMVSKKKSYTYKNKGNWKLVYKEVYNTRVEATNREKQLKSFKGREFIRKVILAP